MTINSVLNLLNAVIMALEGPRYHMIHLVLTTCLKFKAQGSLILLLHMLHHDG